MTIETRCSGCGKRLAVADEHAGRKARCPACGQIYTVPFVSPAAETDPTKSDAQPAEQIDPALAETTAGNFSSTGPSDSAFDMFWMQTTDGAEYGPVDRAHLNRWFSEGRVGQGYQIRQGENGPWQSADLYRPESSPASSDSNPYAAQPTQVNPYAQSSGSAVSNASLHSPMPQYAKADPSGLVLTMGIVSWVCLLVCAPIGWIPGLIAWVSGSRGLKDIQAGHADPSNTNLVQIGYYLGMVNVILTLLSVVAFAGLFAIALISEM
jgi:phage FluMu protein Com